MKVVCRGDAFLPDIGLPELRMMRKKEPVGKSRDRLRAAVMRKKGCSQKAIAEDLGCTQGTISGWLNRFQDEGLEGRHDRKSPGRPSRLLAEQQEEVRRDLSLEPCECGFERGTWTGPLLSLHISRKFGVQYIADGALKLAHRLGFSVRKSRPVHHKTASPEALKKYLEDTKDAITERVAAGYEVFCMDAAGITNAGSAQRGIRRRGGTETIRTNFSKKSIKMIGAIGSGSRCHINFRNKANSESAIELFEQLRKEHGKVFVILDNAGAHKSKAIREYLETTGGDVVLWYLPPYTPQHNPIEILWREIKRAIGGRYFEGGFEELERSVRRMLKEGEVRIVKLFDYMLDAISRAKTHH